MKERSRVGGSRIERAQQSISGLIYAIRAEVLGREQVRPVLVLFKTGQWPSPFRWLRSLGQTNFVDEGTADGGAGR